MLEDVGGDWLGIIVGTAQAANIFNLFVLVD